MGQFESNYSELDHALEGPLPLHSRQTISVIPQLKKTAN